MYLHTYIYTHTYIHAYIYIYTYVYLYTYDINIHTYTCNDSIEIQDGVLSPYSIVICNLWSKII